MDIAQHLDGGDLGQWYKIGGTDSQIKVRQIKPKRYQELRQQCRTYRNVRGARQAEFDMIKFNRLLCNEAVTDWRKIKVGKVELPCTTENKVKVDDNWEPFHLTWNAVLTSNEQAELELVEGERKNS